MPKGTRSVWFYRRQLLTSPAHALVMIVPVALGLLTINLMLAVTLLVVAESVLFGILPHTKVAQAAIDARLERLAREAAAATRAGLLSRMAEEHRREFANLEMTAALVRRNMGSATLVDPMGIDRLLAAYVRLAIEHRTATESLHLSDGVSRREGELAFLEASDFEQNPELKASLERRLAVLRARAQAQRSARIERAALERDLATVADTINWMRECCTCARSEAVRSEVMNTVDVTCNDETTLRDLSRVHDAPPVDPRVLELGRPDPSVVQPQIRVAVTPQSGPSIPPPAGVKQTVADPVNIEPLVMSATRL